MLISRDQSMEMPSEVTSSLNDAMFFGVRTAGCSPSFMAAFSAGSPNESHPSGCSTSKPRFRAYRASTSVMQYTRTCPMCISPEG